MYDRKSLRLRSNFGPLDHPDASMRPVFEVSAADGHPGTLAHSINAQALFDYLVAHQLIPADKPSNDHH